MSEDRGIVHSLDRRDRAAAAQMITRAFHDDPAWAMVFDDADERERVYERMWPAVVKYAARWGEARTVDGVAGIGCWLRPGQTKMTALRSMLAGFVWVATALDAPKRREFLGLLEYLDEVHERVMPEPHWYLSCLAVDPDRQGEGIGALLLEDGSAMAVESGHPVYLESITEANTAYYEHRGFETIESGTVEPSGFPYWCMVWRP